MLLSPWGGETEEDRDIEGEESDMEESPPGDMQELERGGDRRSGGERE